MGINNLDKEENSEGAIEYVTLLWLCFYDVSLCDGNEKDTRKRLDFDSNLRDPIYSQIQGFSIHYTSSSSSEENVTKKKKMWNIEVVGEYKGNEEKGEGRLSKPKLTGVVDARGKVIDKIACNEVEKAHLVIYKVSVYFQP